MDHPRGGRVFCRKHGSGTKQRPVDPDLWIVPANRALIEWLVRCGALIQYDRAIGGHDEPVRETRRHPERVLICVGQLGAYPSSERGSGATQIDHRIVDTPVQHAHEFSLRHSQLVVESTQDVPMRDRHIVLHELRVEPVGRKRCRMPRLKKVATVVDEDVGDDEADVW